MRYTGRRKHFWEGWFSIFFLSWLSFLLAKWLNWVSRQGSCHGVWCILFMQGPQGSCVICPVFKLRSECLTHNPSLENRTDRTRLHTLSVSSVEMSYGTCHSCQIVCDPCAGRSDSVSTSRAASGSSYTGFRAKSAHRRLFCLARSRSWNCK